LSRKDERLRGGSRRLQIGGTCHAAGKFDMKELERRMRGAMDTLKKEFAGLRTGRASTHLLDPVVVNVYGQRMPINQVATVSTPDARTYRCRSGTRAR
jgi:hypothetical protein